MAPLPPVGIDLHDLVPGDSPDSSLKYHPLKSCMQNTGCLRGFSPPHTSDFHSPCWGQGGKVISIPQQGHFSSPMFAELVLTWELGRKHLPTLAVCGPSPPCLAWLTASCTLVPGHLLQEALPLCFSLSLPLSHRREIFALDFCLCPCLGQGPHALCSGEWGGFAPIQVPRASLLFLLSISHCIPSCVNPSGWVKTLQ